MTAEWRVGGGFDSRAGVEVLSEPTDTSLITLNEDVITPQCLLKLSDKDRAAQSPDNRPNRLSTKRSDYIRQINVIQGRLGQKAAVHETTVQDCVSRLFNTSCRIYKQLITQLFLML